MFGVTAQEWFDLRFDLLLAIDFLLLAADVYLIRRGKRLAKQNEAFLELARAFQTLMGGDRVAAAPPPAAESTRPWKVRRRE